MFSEEKCPDCGFEDYDIDKYWDDFDENGGVRVWECTCPKCHRNFDITYEYKCTEIIVGQRKLTSGRHEQPAAHPSSPHYIIPHPSAQVKPFKCYNSVTKLLQLCYKSVTALDLAQRLIFQGFCLPLNRRPAACIQYTSWKAGSCPEKSTAPGQAGNSIRAGASQNGNHRFLACGKLRYSARILEYKDPPQAGNSLS